MRLQISPDLLLQKSFTAWHPPFFQMVLTISPRIGKSFLIHSGNCKAISSLVIPKHFLTSSTNGPYNAITTLTISEICCDWIASMSLATPLKIISLSKKHLTISTGVSHEAIAYKVINKIAFINYNI